jgi:hypothetical protein
VFRNAAAEVSVCVVLGFRWWGVSPDSSQNGLRDNETRGERDRTASGPGGVHQQLPVRETHR